ncbi:MAG: hypothetical protein ACW981_14660 [Candidatus Hodarchaeales archaeon]
MIDTTLDPIFSIFPITASIISLILSIDQKKNLIMLYGELVFSFSS